MNFSALAESYLVARDFMGRLLDEVLVLRFQAGDDSAFVPLVARYQDRLLYFVRRLVADRGAADDIVQDVWLRAFQHLGDLQEPAAFAPWLYRIARNRASTEISRDRSFVPLDDDLHASTDDAAEGFGKEMAPAIHECLGHLRPEHREVLLLRFVEGMSYEDIGRTVGCKIGTVRSRIHYARRALRRKIEERSGE